ncbi:MAG TPA: hypothetical protein VF785_02690 [Gemmatimonadaceae bacterium]
MLTADGTLLTIGGDSDPGRIDSALGQIAARLCCPVHPKRQIVFVGTTLVGIPVDTEANRSIRGENGRLLIEERTLGRQDFGAVEVKVDWRSQLYASVRFGGAHGLFRPAQAIRSRVRAGG